MTTVTRQRFSIICNAYIALSVCYVIVCKLAQSGIGTLIYYTQDSNVLAGIVSICFVATALKNGAWHGKACPSPLLRTWRFLATCCLSITFLVSLFVLAPYPESGGFVELFFTPYRFTMHLTSPIISLASFIAFENGPETPALPKHVIALSLVPSALYAAVLYPINALSLFRGPYPFLLVHEMPLWLTVVWFIALLAAFALVAWAIRLFANKRASHTIDSKQLR